jgi:hypothetical protein
MVKGAQVVGKVVKEPEALPGETEMTERAVSRVFRSLICSCQPDPVFHFRFDQRFLFSILDHDRN